MDSVRIASRESPLALIQAAEAIQTLEVLRVTGEGKKPLTWHVEALPSLGDIQKDLSLLDGQAPADFFTRELDKLLLEGRADCAVHSAKDLPYPLHRDLRVVALLPARNQGDCLVGQTEHGCLRVDFDWLPQGARVGTSSPSRRDQLLAVRPDLQIQSIRGTIEERIALVESGFIHAVVVARCALERLGLEARITQDLPFETHPLQGHLAVTARADRKDLRDLWAPVDVRKSWGRVSLVGAGPGDPELLTLKAQRILSQADVILHDALANPAILPRVSEGKPELIFAGKRKGSHALTQDQTNSLMHRLAREGRFVVRLKGGDPFVFGRGGEELRYLEERLVAVEVVPGVSSAMAAAACTGISLTDRDYAASLALCTGYPLDRVQVPSADTRVYYMGLSNQADIARLHLASGYPGTLGVMQIQDASLPSQKIRFANLEALAQADAPGTSPLDPAGFSAEGPVITVVGPVVPPEGISPWWDRRWKLWYTGTDADAVYRRGLERLHPEGLALIHQPLVEIQGLEDWTAVDRAFASLAASPDSLPTRPDWIFFTSRHGVEFFWQRLEALGLDSRVLAGIQVAAVGRSTAQTLAQKGIHADLVPERESGRGLAQAFLAHSAHHSLSGLRVLLPSSDLALAHLDAALAQAGHSLERLTIYRTIPRDNHPGIDLYNLDEVLLSSPSAARTLFRFYPTLPETLQLQAMGEETRAVVQELWPRRQP